MEVCNRQPLAEDEGVQWNLKKDGTKTLLQATRFITGITVEMRHHYKSKSKDYTDSEMKIWRGRGIKVMKCTLPREVSRTFKLPVRWPIFKSVKRE